MKRALIAVGILASTLLAGVIGWVIIAGRDVPPPDVSDLTLERPHVPEAENAYTYFLSAAAALHWPEDFDHASRLGHIEDSCKYETEVVGDLIEKNLPALALVEKGLACRACQLPVYWIGDDADYLGKWRKLARVFTLKAMREQSAQEYTQAIESCSAAIRFGDVIQANAESSLDYLVGLTMLAGGLRQTRRLMRERGLTAGQLAGLADRLRSLTPPDQGVVRALKGEFRFGVRVVDGIANGSLDKNELSLTLRSFPWPRSRSIGYLFQPNKTKAEFAEYYRHMIRNACRVRSEMDVCDPNERLGLSGNRLKQILTPNVIGRILYGLLSSAIGPLLDAHRRHECSLTGTRLVVTCRAYEATHGDLPDSLEALLPKYLDAVPIDPYDGRPFRYSREKRIVYSVFRDLEDSGGSAPHLENSDDLGADAFAEGTPDAVFRLGPAGNRQAPPGETSQPKKD